MSIISLIKINSYKKYIISIIILGTIINFIDLLYWIHLVEDLSFFKNFSLINYKIYNLTSYLSPLIILFFAFFIVIKISTNLRSFEVIPSKTSTSHVRSRCIIIIFLIGLLVAAFPYLSISSDVVFGVDYQDYLDALNNLNNESTIQPYLEYSAWAIFVFQKIFSLSASSGVKHFFIIIIPIFGVVNFYLANELFDDEDVSFYSGIFSILGINLCVNYYSYFIANTVGLIFLYISIIFLFKSLKTNDIRNMSISIIACICLFLIHPWTYYQYIFPLILMLVYLYIIKSSNKIKHIKYILVFVIVILLFIPSYNELRFNNADVVMILSQNLLNLNSNLLKNMFQTTYNFSLFWYGGAVSFYLQLFLISYGVYNFIKIKFPLSKLYIYSIIFCSSMIFIIGDELIKSRIMYNLPLGILTSYGYNYLFKSIPNIEYRKYVTYYILSSTLLYSIRFLSNIT